MTNQKDSCISLGTHNGCRISLDMLRISKVHFTSVPNALRIFFPNAEKALYITTDKEETTNHNALIMSEDALEDIAGILAIAATEREYGFVADTGKETDYHDWWAFTTLTPESDRRKPSYLMNPVYTRRYIKWMKEAEKKYSHKEVIAIG